MYNNAHDVFISNVINIWIYTNSTISTQINLIREIYKHVLLEMGIYSHERAVVTEVATKAISMDHLHPVL